MTPELKGFLLLSVIKMLFVFTVIMIGVALLTLMERKVSAWMQNRRGPNRVGLGRAAPAGRRRGQEHPQGGDLPGALQPVALPAGARALVHPGAPALGGDPVRGAAAGGVRLHRSARSGGFVHHGLMPMVVADLPIGFLFVLAISSMGVYGIALAGWSSNSKYALLGGLRACAQMVSYEVAMGMSLIPVLLMSGNVSFAAIIREQQTGLWYVLPLFFSFFIFLISGFAETNRLPFDLPEAESELIAGYHTEYSAMKFSFFFIAEYANVVTVCAMVSDAVLRRLGHSGRAGTSGAGSCRPSPPAGFFFLKVMFWIFFVMWIRWTLPRFRYDQLMALGWKVLMPLALAYIMIVCTAIYGIEHLAGITDPTLRSLALFGVNVVLAFLVFGLVDSGAFIKGSNRRQQQPREVTG